MSAVHQMHLRVLALLVVPALLIAEPALAVTRVDEAPSVTVRYHDLNLSSSEGIATLYGRIHAAAIDVCKPVEDSQITNLALLREWNECVAHAVSDAVRRIHNERLSAYQWERIRGWKFRSVDTPIHVAGR
jgi:UrcA family protein